MKIFKLLICILTFTVISFFTQDTSAKPSEVNLAAAASLKDCMKELITIYKTIKPDVEIVPNYEASGTLQTQIENGAAVDVFISANQEKMDLLEKKKLLVPETRKDLLLNKVVLIIPKNSKSPIKSFKDLGSAKLKDKGLAIGDPKVVPAGKYATEIFETLGITKDVMPKVVFAQNVRVVLTYVAQQEVDAGIVYLTDALMMADKVEIVEESPKDSHEPTIYPAAVTTTGNNPNGGKDFLKFLSSTEAVKVFKKYGFAMKSEPRQ